MTSAGRKNASPESQHLRTIHRRCIEVRQRVRRDRPAARQREGHEDPRLRILIVLMEHGRFEPQRVAEPALEADLVRIDSLGAEQALVLIVRDVVGDLAVEPAALVAAAYDA